jgi:hypothetical protein
MKSGFLDDAPEMLAERRRSRESAVRQIGPLAGFSA